jgi:hypothetical protein
LRLTIPAAAMRAYPQVVAMNAALPGTWLALLPLMA